MFCSGSSCTVFLYCASQTDTRLFVGLRLHAARIHPSSGQTDTLTDEKKPAVVLAIQHNPCNLVQRDHHSQDGAEWNLSGWRRTEGGAERHTEIFLLLIAMICLQRENNTFFISYLSDNRLYNIIHKKLWDKFSYISSACINTVSYNDMDFFMLHSLGFTTRTQTPTHAV